MTPHPKRKAMRLPKYDYSLPGAYFVTACTKNRKLLFGSLEAKVAVESAWHSLLDIFANIELDEFIVMPNYVHCILCIMREGAYRLHPGTWKNKDRDNPFGSRFLQPAKSVDDYWNEII